MTKINPVPEGTEHERIHVYDLTRWKPIPIQEFTNLLAIAIAEASDKFNSGDDEHTTPLNVEWLPDGRQRLTYVADLIMKAGDKENPPESDRGPYLMLVTSMEKAHNGAPNASYAFVRTDVDIMMS